jgi:hypothetical protein
MSFKIYLFALVFKNTDPPPVNGSINLLIYFGKCGIISGNNLNLSPT